MKQALVRLSLVAAVMATASALAYAQGATTSSLSGKIADASGGVLPGADVTVKNNATGDTYSAVTNEHGAFSIPALVNGSYAVTVSLSGFKTVMLREVTVNAGVAATVSVALEVGELAETIVVQGESSAIVQTQSPAISTTLNIKEVSNLPLVSRDALQFVVNLPGVNTPGGNRQTSISGLPRTAINITIDGINSQDNYLKSTDAFTGGGRLDEVEEVTVTMAAQGAESAGQGAVQIQFVTRSGSNQWRGSGYHYYRNDALNANTWFNKRNGIAKPELVQHQPGGRLGGPIIIPGLFNGRNKAFFFVNYEELRQPSDVPRNRTVLSPSAQAGLFRYATPAGVQEVNLFALAAANGQLATADPTIGRLVADIHAATGTTGSIIDLTDPNVRRYAYNVAENTINRRPTVRLDYNVTEKHRLMGVGRTTTNLSTPDTLNTREPFFPGFPISGTRGSTAYSASASLRSTLTSNLVNELRGGSRGGSGIFFSKELNPGMWGGTPVADQAGFHLNLNGACCTGGALTNAGSTTANSARQPSSWLVENTLSWLKGTHNISLGGAWTQIDLWLENRTMVPQINFGIVSGDPADAMFNPTNFPGASTTNLNAARGLYSILVGRVASIAGNARLDENTGRYQYLGLAVQRARMREMDAFVQDNWRLRPNLTINYGVRYALQLPFTSLNDSYSAATLADAWGVSGLASGCNPSDPRPDTCNLFKPGVLEGKQPQFNQFSEGQRAFNIDWNNVAPSVGFNWTPTARGGWLRRLLGDPGDTAIRSGFARAFTREGMATFTNVFAANPGVLIDASRTQPLGNLGAVPILFRDRNRLGAPPFPETPQYPLTEVVTGSVNIFDPNLQVPYADSWTAGIQRAISRNMAVEVRYVGTRSRDLWEPYNYNEINIVENGFLDEFRLAQTNLQANIAAGRGNTFRYFGPGTGTSPLPTFLAYFSGQSREQAGNAALYTSPLFANSTFVDPLARFNPAPHAAADALDADAARRVNALNAGLAANFLVANPHLLGGANVTGNGGFTRYHSLQLELRRRLADGLQFNTSYVYGRAYQSVRYSFRKPFMSLLDAGTPGGVDHAFKSNWVYELPFGRGKRFASNAGGVLDRVIGGWQLHGMARIQSGTLVDLGNVRLVGFTRDELRDMFKTRIDGGRRVWMMPQAIIDETVKAFSVSATSPTGYGPGGPPSGRYFAPANSPDCIEVALRPSTPDPGFRELGFGDCGVRSLVLRGPVFKVVDLSVTKLVPVKGRIQLEFRVEMLNALNSVNFTPIGGVGSSSDAFELTTLNGEITSRLVQLVSRISW